VAYVVLREAIHVALVLFMSMPPEELKEYITNSFCPLVNGLTTNG
jgi:hypothetical protein